MVPVRLAWLAALHEGNCLKIAELLAGSDGPELVCVWPDEKEAETVGYGWKGCNALHVAVKQGWSYLVFNILNMFDDGGTPQADMYSKVDHDSHPFGIRKAPIEKLKEMILAFDGNCDLDTIAISVLNGDHVITEALAEALLLKCGCNPYRTDREGKSQTSREERNNETDVQGTGVKQVGEKQMSFWDDQILNQIQLRSVTAHVLQDMGSDEQIVRLYFHQHCEFNFLRIDEYLFHALSSVCNSVVSHDSFHRRYVFQGKAETVLSSCRKKLLTEARNIGGFELVTYIFRMKDSRGRTPLHIAVDHDTLWDVLDCLADVHPDTSCLDACLNATDRAGRTALHRAAAALDFPKSIQELINHPRTDLDCCFEFNWTVTKYCLDLRKVSLRNGFGSWLPCVGSIKDWPTDDQAYGTTPLHLAVFNPCGSQILEMLVSEGKKRWRQANEGEKQGTELIRSQELVSLRSLGAYKSFKASIDCSDSRELIGDCSNYQESHCAYRGGNHCAFCGGSHCAYCGGSYCAYCGGSHCVTCQGRGSHCTCVECHGLTPLGLAALVGNIPVLRRLVEDHEAKCASDHGRRKVGNRGGNIGPLNADYGFPGLHLAAAVGDSVAVETILASYSFSPDYELPHIFCGLKPSVPPTAIHAAVQGWEEIEEVRKSLLHVVNFRDGWCKRASGLHRSKAAEAERYSRQTCVNLLAQAGATIWSMDEHIRSPSPGPATSPEFREWWSGRVERKIQEIKTGMRAAATGIVVTAALVTTASFVGPLQPPMGYAEDGQMQLGSVLLKLFIVFDTLAFYASIAAIVQSMSPHLPIPRESLKSEVRQSRTSLLLAVSSLIISILCMLISFGVASVAVVRNDGVWNQGGLTMSTMAVGGIICLWTIASFVKRLVRLANSAFSCPGKYSSFLGYLLHRLSQWFKNKSYSRASARVQRLQKLIEPSYVSLIRRALPSQRGASLTGGAWGPHPPGMGLACEQACERCACRLLSPAPGRVNSAA